MSPVLQQIYNMQKHPQISRITWYNRTSLQVNIFSCQIISPHYIPFFHIWTRSPFIKGEFNFAKFTRKGGGSGFSHKKGRVDKIGGFFKKKGRYHLFSYQLTLSNVAFQCCLEQNLKKGRVVKIGGLHKIEVLRIFYQLCIYIAGVIKSFFEMKLLYCVHDVFF